MTAYRHTVRASRYWISIMLLLALGECGGCKGDKYPVQYSDAKGALDCRVIVYAPDYSRSDTRPSVEVVAVEGSLELEAGAAVR